MAGTGAGYDLSATTYSPDGRIFQVEYATKAMDNSATALAIVCRDGIVFATEKLKLSRMLIRGTNRRTYPITRTSGIAIAGMIPDGRDLVTKAREEATGYRGNYGEEIPAHTLAERVGMYMHHYTKYWSVRPFGAGVLIGKYDEKAQKCSLFSVDPSGLVQKYTGKALGKGRQLANTEIEKLDLAGLSCQDALFHVARILHKVHDEQKPFELEVNWICQSSGWEHQIVPQELIDAAEERAKKALEDEDED